MAHQHVTVEQHLHPQLLEHRQPVHIVDVILVVARDGEHPIAGMQLLQWFHIIGAGIWGAVHQVAGDQGHIRLQGIGFIDHCLHPGRLQQSAGVQVGQLHQAQAIHFRGQMRQGDVHRFHIRHADRLPHAQQCQADANDAQRGIQASIAPQRAPLRT